MNIDWPFLGVCLLAAFVVVAVQERFWIRHWGREEKRSDEQE